MRLKDKVVLVTASTRGIGLACVKACAKEGASVYMAARNMERAQEIANTLDGVKCVYNDAAYTTGQILTICGGFGLATPVYGDLADKTSRR